MKWNRFLLRLSLIFVKIVDFVLPILWKLVKVAFYILAGFVILLFLFLIF